jgi:hypothetical protein
MNNQGNTGKVKKNSQIGGDLGLRLRNSPAFSLIFQYPRIFLLIFFTILMILLLLPISFNEKIMIGLRGVVFGFFIAFGLYCFKLWRQTSKK